ncbi:hypothetical protein IRJ41_023037 [Triplophysa rosa]|uniref:Uncharacterized protein n=1 Tax=Triplophysa rosa TaxID=992332 RepID=A0A9W7X6H2_TRIRA|nr:hypothetical protein IRJ41_023037 [Triplophysa rosa]
MRATMKLQLMGWKGSVASGALKSRAFNIMLGLSVHSAHDVLVNLKFLLLKTWDALASWASVIKDEMSCTLLDLQVVHLISEQGFCDQR